MSSQLLVYLFHILVKIGPVTPPGYPTFDPPKRRNLGLREPVTPVTPLAHIHLPYEKKNLIKLKMKSVKIFFSPVNGIYIWGNWGNYIYMGYYKPYFSGVTAVTPNICSLG